MSSEDPEMERAIAYLDEVLREAVEAGADTVELEPVAEGLEIGVLASGSGIGTVLKDLDLAMALIDLIIVRAGLEQWTKGKMTWNVLGEDRRIAVEEYHSFGGSCYRLKLGPPRQRPRK